MVEIPYSDVIKDISIIIWPGKKSWSELGGILESEFGFLPGLLELILFAGHSCVAFCGA